jgi:carbon storage regulator
MLILTRRPNETLMIGGAIKVHVLSFKGGQVRLGIEAPPNVLIDREEVHLRKKEEAERRARNKGLPPAVTPEHSREAVFQGVEEAPVMHRVAG